MDLFIDRNLKTAIGQMRQPRLNRQSDSQNLLC
jgi:hypothetical protein